MYQSFYDTTNTTQSQFHVAVEGIHVHFSVNECGKITTG